MSLQRDNILDKSNLYTPEIVAEKLSVTTRSVTKWLRTKKLRGVKIGRLWRIKPDDLAAFIDPVTFILDNAPVDHSKMSAEYVKAIKEAEDDVLHNRVLPLSRNMKELEV